MLLASVSLKETILYTNDWSLLVERCWQFDFETLPVTRDITDVKTFILFVRTPFLSKNNWEKMRFCLLESDVLC